MKKYDGKTTRYLLSKLKEMFLEERWSRFNEVISGRTRHITVVLEDIYQPLNANAVIRTCELLGIQDLHVIENINPYEINPDILVGSDKWISMHHYNGQKNNTPSCLKKLKKKGYRIVATSPHADDCSPEELPLDLKTALVFGNEGYGLSEDVFQSADAFLKIPSFGFTESYNLSVSVAICLYQLMGRLRTSNINWQLSQDEKDALLLEYALKSIRKPQLIVNTLLKDMQ